MKPTLVIKATWQDMDSVAVIRQEGDLVRDAFIMKRDALFQALAHQRVRDQFADVIYDNRP